MNSKLVTVLEWLWATRDQDIWMSPSVLTKLNVNYTNGPVLSNTESLSVFRYLQKADLIFPVAAENGQIQYIIDKLKDDQWASTINDLKRPKWKTNLFNGLGYLSSPSIFLLGAVVSPIINDLYGGWVKPHIMPKIDEQAIVQPNAQGQKDHQPPVAP